MKPSHESDMWDVPDLKVYINKNDYKMKPRNDSIR